jgi:hypothetical protein
MLCSEDRKSLKRGFDSTLDESSNCSHKNSNRVISQRQCDSEASNDKNNEKGLIFIGLYLHYRIF